MNSESRVSEVNVILFGSPGVGKGTYASILSKKYKIPHISSGHLIREEIKSETELGKKMEAYFSKGDLAPDEMVTRIIRERIKKSDCKGGFLLDGYPRTIPQAKMMEKFKKIDLVLNFFASDEVILQRLGGRRTCRECEAIFHVRNIPPKVEGICDHCGGELYQREDETPKAIKERLRVYREKTEPLINYFREKDLIADIDANHPFEEVDKIISQCDAALSKIK